MKRVLVTGGAGFLGANLCRHLLREGCEVTCLDNLSTGRLENIQPLLEMKTFHFLHQDVRFPFDAAVDRIYNLACPASPVHYQKDPLSTLQSSVLGAINVLELARRSGARVLQASTSEVYGDPDVHPQPESYWGRVNPIGPRACYDEGKRSAETLFFDYHRQHDVDIKVARLFNTYGPLMHPEDGRMIANFIVQALRNQELTVYGDGSQTRSVCYVDDTITALTRLMESRSGFTGPVNIGSDEELTVLEVARYVLAATCSGAGICFGPRPVDDPAVRRPVLNLARQELGWQARISLKEGLMPTVAYFRSVVPLLPAP